jgi:GT2 family glycosyltransferase
MAAVDSLRRQEPPLDEVFAVDDGSSDHGADLLEAAGVRVLRQPGNLGRGACRQRAMQEAKHAFVVCCDATNTLPVDFVSRALVWFRDPSVAAVFGLITDPAPEGVVARWRARHLFKANAAHTVSHGAPLITYGTVVRASAAEEVGGYDPRLRHSEDGDLGERLLKAGHDVVADPSLEVHCNIRNSVGEVLERYWRWYAGKDESFGLRAYFQALQFSVKAMAWRDLRLGDPPAALVSLLVPQYQLWRFIRRRVGI